MGMPCPGYGAPPSTSCLPTEVECPGHLPSDPSTCVPMGMPCPGYGAPPSTSCLPTEIECPGHLLPDATFGPSTCVPMGMPCPGYGATSTPAPTLVPTLPPTQAPAIEMTEAEAKKQC